MHVDLLINRIKDAYFDLDRDTERRDRFYAAFAHAIQPSPAQIAAALRQHAMMQQQAMASAPGNGGEPGAPAQQPPQSAPAPQPSVLDVIGSMRGQNAAV